MKIIALFMMAILSACASTPSSFQGADRGARMAADCKSPKAVGSIHVQRQCAGGEETDGLKEGIWCCFDDNDQLVMAAQFHQGLKDGRTELYSAHDGHLETISTWKHGQLDGPQMIFNKNATVSSEYSIHDGRFNGELKDYNDDGHLASVHHYQNGVCLDPDHVADEHD